MSLEDWQDCSCIARGCVWRSVFVFFSNAFTAATKMERKLEEDPVEEEGSDIATKSEEVLGDEREIASASMQMGETPHSKSPNHRLAWQARKSLPRGCPFEARIIT